MSSFKSLTITIIGLTMSQVNPEINLSKLKSGVLVYKK